MTPKTPAFIHFDALMNGLNNMGVRDHAIAEAIGYSRQYLCLMRKEKRTPSVNILTALQSLLIAKLAETQAIHQREADRLATQRHQIESELAA